MRRAVPCAVVVLASSGCAGRTESPQADVRGTVQTFLSQCAQGHGERVLETLVPAGRLAFADGGSTLRGCARILRLRPAPSAADYAGASVALRSFDGGQAGAIVSIGGRRAAVELSRGVEWWLISGPS